MKGLLNEFLRVRKSFKEQINDLVSSDKAKTTRINTLFEFIQKDFFADSNKEDMQKKRLECGHELLRLCISLTKRK